MSGDLPSLTRIDHLIEVDRAHLIHPVTNYRAHEANGATLLVHGQGLWLTDAFGRRSLDAFSGLWCVNLGYGQERLVEAAARQMRRLPYATTFFGYASEPAVELAGRLTALAPDGLTHVYFTLGGSDAVDSAMRFITRYFNATGRPQKKQFIALDKGYHGSSFIGAGLTGLPAFHQDFDVPQSWQHHIPAPNPYRNAQGLDGDALVAASVASLEAKVAQIGRDRVAAFICEPIMGSGGVIVPPQGWLKAMETCCRALGILFVVDEVITGFGRTGPLFACEAEGVSPDMLLLAKGLTSGYAPMGALLMSNALYQGIAGEPGATMPIGHGHTYSGHPVSAAVALEALDLYLDGGALANGRTMATQLAAGLGRLVDHPLVGNVRARGMLAAIELVADKESRMPFAPGLRIAERISIHARRNEIILRAFADGSIGLAPALICNEREMDEIIVRLALTLDDLLSEPEVRGGLR